MGLAASKNDPELDQDRQIGDAEFAALYGHYLRTVPEVTVAHGSVRGHLRALKGVKAA